jgi:hypothetical protein
VSVSTCGGLINGWAYKWGGLIFGGGAYIRRFTVFVKICQTGLGNTHVQ